MFPETLTIIDSDLGGNYGDGRDCVIARALKRLGVPFTIVGGCGYVDNDERIEVQYKWEDGTQFDYDTAQKTGQLIREPIRTPTD